MTARSDLTLTNLPAGQAPSHTLRRPRLMTALALAALLLNGQALHAAEAHADAVTRPATTSRAVSGPAETPHLARKKAPRKSNKTASHSTAKSKRPATSNGRAGAGKVALAATSVAAGGAAATLAAATTSKAASPAAAAPTSGVPEVGTKATSARTELSGWLDRPEAHDLVERLAREAQIPTAWSREQLAQAQRSTRVQQLIAPPPRGTAKDWAAYRARFVEPKRIQAGADFWRTHERWLSQAQSRWGVPAEVIVGIVGVETFYGRMTGGFRALDALATLAFDYPEGGRNRSAFFLGELEALLKLAWQQQVAAADYRGSFAGALGLPQFMPSSILKWAVDFDGDGRIQLHDSAPDVIGSVANFLKEHGWQEGLAATFPASPPTDTQDRAVLLAPDINPSFSVSQMRERGTVLASNLPENVGPLALVELQNGDLAPSYVAGTTNFYALTRYNQSSYYAMAVLALGQAVKAAVGNADPLRTAKP